MAYIITLVFFVLVYIGVIYLMKYMRQVALTNAVFVGLVWIPYLMLSLTVYLDVGFYDWNYQNTLPTANVSPFMFTCVPLALILPKRVKPYFLALISLLSVGMFVSTILGCIYNAVIDYKFHIHFTYDYVAHIALSLFGVYIIRSKQVQLDAKHTLIGSLLILGAATGMLILNLIFDTAFFGLSLNGKHNIYNNVLVDNSYVSALLYYAGLVVVLLLGYGYMRWMARPKLEISTHKAIKNRQV